MRTDFNWNNSLHNYQPGGRIAWYRLALSVVALLLLTPSLLQGQSTAYARLVGTVKDQTGAVLPGVEITAASQLTNVSRNAVTGDRGDYLIDKLAPGRYDLRAELPNFKSQVSIGIRLEVNRVVRADLVMTPGKIADQVTVTGQPTILDTDTAEVATVIEEKTILDMPLRGRDLVKLAYLTTGGTQERQEVGTANDQSFYGGGYPTFNGLYSHSNQILLDGLPNQSFMTMRPAVQSTPETVQEFKIITNNYSAEYGRVAGAVINVLSKSGSNDLHGHSWYYFRDERFDASHFFNNLRGGDKQEVNYQIMGASIGGPIIKDRTFFHAHYERFVDDFDTPQFAQTVPTVAMRDGDMSGSGAFGPISQLYDPFNVIDGQRQPFDGNIIPQSRWHPIYTKVMELAPVPEPNVSGVTAQNYSSFRKLRNRVQKFSLRGDHHFEGEDTFFGRFSWQTTPQPNRAQETPWHLMSESTANPSPGWQMGLGWVNPISSTLVTELNASIWGTDRIFDNPTDEFDWGQALGYDDAHLNPVFYPDGSRGTGGMPPLGAAGYPGWSTGWRFWTLDDWGVDLKYSASWKKGNHYLKLGFAHTRNLDVKQYFTAPYNAFFSSGGDNFDGYSTGQITQADNGGITGSTFGEPWADLMLGLPSRSGGNMAGLGGLFSHFNQSHYSWFVNDDWKLTPNLTLNLGLRWEQPRPAYYEGSPDRSFPIDYNYCAFDFTQAQGRIDPVQMMPQGLDISRWEGPMGLAIPFSNLDRRGCYEARWRYLAPRFGLAWRMFGNNRTVLRFGAGLSYDQEFGVLRSRFMQTPRGNVNAIRPRGEEVPTLILGKKLHLPTETELGEYRTCYFSELDWEDGQVYSYNLSIQHEIFPATKLEVGYVGNQGRHIREVSPFNVALPEGYEAPLVGGGTVTLTSEEITAGPRSWIEGDTESRSWSGQRARRLYPQVIPNVIHRPLGNTNYNSLQAKLERRFQDGVALSLGYTWSKAMALNYRGWGDFGGGSREYDRGTLKGPMPHDRTHTFYNATIWQLPFFEGSQGLTRTLLGGWEAAAIVTLTSGAPYRVFYGRNLWNQGTRSRLYPDRLRDGYLSESERSITRWFDTSAFVAPIWDESLPPAERARRSQGNSDPYPLKGDGVQVVDLSLHKRFAVGEDQALDFRVDLFNAFNHTVFFNPNGNIASFAAGWVFNAATARRCGRSGATVCGSRPGPDQHSRLLQPTFRDAASGESSGPGRPALGGMAPGDAWERDLRPGREDLQDVVPGRCGRLEGILRAALLHLLCHQQRRDSMGQTPGWNTAREQREAPQRGPDGNHSGKRHQRPSRPGSQTSLQDDRLPSSHLCFAGWAQLAALQPGTCLARCRGRHHWILGPAPGVVRHVSQSRRPGPDLLARSEAASLLHHYQP